MSRTFRKKTAGRTSLEIQARKRRRWALDQMRRMDRIQELESLTARVPALDLIFDEFA